jgi:pfkB family carbohydrate kinase
VKRLGILGTFVWDTIWTVDDQAAGRPFETWGGVAYSLAGGAAALPDGWEIVPVGKVGRDLEAEAHAFLDTLPGIGPRTAVVPVPEANNRVELRYTDTARRGERLTGGVPAWEWDELAPHLGGLDALYVNYFSGFEVGLEATERLGREFAGPLYADLHSLFLGCPGAGVRQMRRLPDWERWLGAFDAVQLNEDELAMLADSGGPASVHEIPSHGPALALLTLGARGAAYASRLASDPSSWVSRRGRGGEAAESGEVPPTTESAGGDPTGCGDVWGVACFCGLLGGRSIGDAVRRANALAAAKLTHRGATGLYPRLRDAVPPIT